jgi:hypothetical protein
LAGLLLYFCEGGLGLQGVSGFTLFARHVLRHGLRRGIVT